jgi:formylmethanofuran--tetrahydromethanopterin N-formyltransferase
VKVEVEDTFAEAFEGLFMRLMVTARDLKRLKKAAYNATALPSTVINRTEGGVEQWLRREETPDQRVGAIIQFWGMLDRNKPDASLKKFYREASYRIRQGILVVPTTALFNAHPSTDRVDAMERIGHCGDGYEWEETYCGRQVIKIPLMMGDFVVERYLGYGVGVMGGNVWLMCRDEDAALDAGEQALQALRRVAGVVAPFDVCAAGSKPETRYPEIGPTTNHPYCPTLKTKIPDSKTPEGVTSIPEIVVNGVSLEAVKRAMKAAILSAMDVEGVVKVSAGNYGGKLGTYQIFLKELLA